jgi:hypothetical protein
VLIQLDRIIQRLTEFNVEFVLVGGYAAVALGAPVITQDVDVCLNFTKENLERLSAALVDLHPKHRITPQRLPLEITSQNWDSLKNLYLELDWGVLDCLGEVKGLGGYSEVLAVSEKLELPFGVCRILTVEALIRAKQAMGRPADMLTIGYLQAIKGKKDSR